MSILIARWLHTSTASRRGGGMGLIESWIAALDCKCGIESHRERAEPSNDPKDIFKRHENLNWREILSNYGGKFMAGEVSKNNSGRVPIWRETPTNPYSSLSG